MGLGPETYDTPAAGPGKVRRLFVYNGGFLTQRRVRRILRLSGYSLHLGLPRAGDHVAVWGNSPTAHRGLAVANKHGAPVVRVEDALLRSVHPGRTGQEPPLGLLIDHRGMHFDPAQPSDLEEILSSHPLDDTNLLNRARGAIARMQEAHLTKYTGFDPEAEVPAPGYVLVIDQTRGDASVTASGADRARFLEMLVFAQEEHPGCPVVIKCHPETAQGHRAGHFGPEDTNARVRLLDAPVSPWRLFEGAVGVYTVSSQLGFEAIYAGHKPRVFGQPFYAGWGLTTDEFPVARRQRRLTRAQLFAAAMILYPKWYDPYRDRLATLEEAMETLAAQTRAWREDHLGWVGSKISLWKRKPLQQFFGSTLPMRFEDDPARARAAAPRRWLVWAGKAEVGHGDACRIEDGFLRSRGLGAELVPPLSLVCDDLGIYYDPARPSRLEKWIEKRAELRPDQQRRARALIDTIRAAGLSKYNLRGETDLSDLPAGRRILVPGQVEDDASIRTGTEHVRTNADLLRAVRSAEPDALILYKPHPDVEAGLRAGGDDAAALADRVLRHADPIALLAQVDAVWTMTSLLGFEALLRGVSVTTLGAPFYAGWGLTHDLGDIPPRRRATPTLEGLVHATLIDYPRYVDPVTRLPCPVEVVAERLASGRLPRAGIGNRALSKLQGVFASQSHLWRRR
ncbi:beta-3-deoxy-D-manno-oct-2-ulosonic acid transferase [Sulfitobacter alexandrii]|uniref:Beta-3-deoxy-D-manno-oct-2-ulosonic acid transferase n=1 Tax=Sulfitobacter alexandrii TaxID=1917485 RepID=A0A1J0WIF1_9RHOB|nr:capsular polysaccharide biosynthesis protein [Sulfitobacter alexandrii]APE44090.1 beta-3-deoxy-D-manno-oct-2-ulosonic acid transferase [Sulfitobacter alexandrii]